MIGNNDLAVRGAGQLQKKLRRVEDFAHCVVIRFASRERQ